MSTERVERVSKLRMNAPGDLVFRSGAGGKADGVLVPDAAGDIVLMHGEREWMRVQEGGATTVNGVVVDNDAEVYRRFKAWLLEATVHFDGKTDYKAADAIIVAQAGKNLS